MRNINNGVKFYKIALGFTELFFAIPILGGSIIMLNGWAPLWILLGLHIVGLVLTVKTKTSMAGHITGIIGNALGGIPFVGWVFHLSTGILLLVELLIEGVKRK